MLDWSARLDDLHHHLATTYHGGPHGAGDLTQCPGPLSTHAGALADHRNQLVLAAMRQRLVRLRRRVGSVFFGRASLPAPRKAREQINAWLEEPAAGRLFVPTKERYSRFRSIWSGWRRAEQRYWFWMMWRTQADPRARHSLPSRPAARWSVGRERDSDR